MKANGWVYKNYRRVRARSIGQLARGMALQCWPVSGLVHRYYRNRMSPDRWAEINRDARKALAKHPPALEKRHNRAIDNLRKDGLHIASIEDLLGSVADLPSVMAESRALLQRPEVQKQIAARRSENGVKWYVIRVFGFRPRLPVPPALANLILNDKILGIVNSYLGVSSRLKYLDLWYNLPVGEDDPPVDSERYHRDNEDTRMVKMFLYLSDVDEASGPLSYIRGTQPGGRYGDVYPNDPPTGSFPPEDLLNERVPPEQVQFCTGGVGTVVLYDACGFHKGGRATAKPRFILVATYASDAALDLEHYRLQNQDQYQTLAPSGRFAIRAPSQ